MSLPIIEVPGARPWPPRTTTFTARFWEALAEGRFVTTRCRACSRMSFPPQSHCADCLGREVEWIELSGHGRLYSATRVHAGPARFAAELPYTVGIIDLDEGLRLVTRLLADASVAHLDHDMSLVVTRHEDGPLFAAMLSEQASSFNTSIADDA